MRYSDYSKSERTRLRIIEKVAPVFNKKGYAATSLSDLAAATGLSKGSIYGNFKDKDEVALCAFEYNVDFIIKNLKSQLSSAETYLDKLLAYPRTYRRIYKAVLFNGGCPILNTSADADDLNQLLHEAVCKRISSWRASFVALMEKGIQQNEFKQEINPTKVAEVCISLVEGGYAMSKATGEESYLLNSLEEIERVILTLKR